MKIQWMFKVLMLFSLLHAVLGCDVKIPTEGPTDPSALTVNGIQDGQTLNVSYFTITVSDPGHKYQSFQYVLDDESFPGNSTYTGSFDTPTVVTVQSEGNHTLYVRGAYANGLFDLPLSFHFTVATLQETAGGRYTGDSVVYYSNYSGMRVSFITYSGARNASTVTGTLTFGGGRQMMASGVSVDNHSWPADVELLITGITDTESVRASGSGIYNYLNLTYMGVDTQNTSIWGDIRLYSNVTRRTLIADCNSMHAYNQGNLPDLQSVLTLYSFENRYFFGHVRLINYQQNKVLTYNVTGDAGAGGLNPSGDGLPLNLNNPSGCLTFPTPSVPWNGNGYLTITTDGTGQIGVSRISINLPGYAVYDSVPESVSMRKTFSEP